MAFNNRPKPAFQAVYNKRFLQLYILYIVQKDRGLPNGVITYILDSWYGVGFPRDKPSYIQLIFPDHNGSMVILIDLRRPIVDWSAGPRWQKVPLWGTKLAIRGQLK